MKLDEIIPIAEKYKDTLEPYCKRIEIAGSVRRKKPECRDIELVIIRYPDKLEELKSIVGEWKKIRGDITGRYTQRMLPEGVKLDIFIAVDDGSNWGNIYLIRTGNWKFSRFMMGIRSKQVGLIHANGYLCRANCVPFEDCNIPCYEEQDVFDLLDMKWIPPEERSWE